MAYRYFYIWLPLTILYCAKKGRRNLNWKFYKKLNAAYYVLYSSRSTRCIEGEGLKSPPPLCSARPIYRRATARLNIADSFAF